MMDDQKVDRKSSDGKLQMHLIRSDLTRQAAAAASYGADKYGVPASWRNAPVEDVYRYVDAAERHLSDVKAALVEGKKDRWLADDSQLSHLAHLAATVSILIEFAQKMDLPLPEQWDRHWLREIAENQPGHIEIGEPIDMMCPDCGHDDEWEYSDAERNDSDFRICNTCGCCQQWRGKAAGWGIPFDQIPLDIRRGASYVDPDLLEGIQNDREMQKTYEVEITQPNGDVALFKGVTLDDPLRQRDLGYRVGDTLPRSDESHPIDVELPADADDEDYITVGHHRRILRTFSEAAARRLEITEHGVAARDKHIFDLENECDNLGWEIKLLNETAEEEAEVNECTIEALRERLRRQIDVVADLRIERDRLIMERSDAWRDKFLKPGVTLTPRVAELLRRHGHAIEVLTDDERARHGARIVSDEAGQLAPRLKALPQADGDDGPSPDLERESD